MVQHFQCCTVDILHQEYNGMSKHVCEAVYLLIDKNFAEAVALLGKAEPKCRLLEMRNNFQARVPKQGLEAAALNAEETSCEVATKASVSPFHVFSDTPSCSLRGCAMLRRSVNKS